MFTFDWGKTIQWCKGSVWTFPLALTIVLLLFTVLRVSGSSVGVYHSVLYGASSRDPNLLYGKPQAIRSDEWLSTTQIIASQTKSGFHKVNPDMGSGRDLALEDQVPYKDWSTVFKPQNWLYFVLPLEYAFAFQWWLMIYLLIISCYFFTLRVLGRKSLSIIFSLAMALSPFALWWYQAPVFMGLAYGFFMLLLGMRVLNDEPIPYIKNNLLKNSLYVAAVAFVATSFGLILYPPFQIPIAIVVLAFLIGYFLHKRYDGDVVYKLLLKRAGLLVCAAFISGVFGGLFILNNRAAIHSLNSTVYPGARTVVSGNLHMLQVFDGFLMPLLQSDNRGAHFFTNQSEASNFILLLPFLLLPGFVLLWYEFKKHRRIDWVFLLIQLCGLLFLVRAYVPFGSVFYKVLLLQKVPNERLVIGMGFVGMLQIIYFIKKLAETKIRRARLQPLALLYGLSCFIVLLWTGSFVREHYPLFIHRWSVIGFLALLFTAIIIALLVNRPRLALLILLLFTLGSGFRIIPLYHGLGFDSSNTVTAAMDSISKPTDHWATVDNIYFENLGMLAGRDSVTGVQVYPDLNFWRQIGGKQYDDVYNREGHVLFTDSPAVTAPVQLVQADYFQIKLACTPFIENNVQFFVATQPLQPLSCLRQVKTVSYPNLTFYLYKVTANRP